LRISNLTFMSNDSKNYALVPGWYAAEIKSRPYPIGLRMNAIDCRVKFAFRRVPDIYTTLEQQQHWPLNWLRCVKCRLHMFVLQRTNSIYNMHKIAIPTSDKMTVSVRKINSLCCLQKTPLLLLRTKINEQKQWNNSCFWKLVQVIGCLWAVDG
jgi:hypothetical protein